MAKIIVEEGIKVVTTGAGNPAKYMPMWKEAGVIVIPVVASVGLARLMERAGADAVHIPVIVAGGIADGRGFAASMMLGAQGVQIGTRFITATESIVHENYKQKVIQAKDIDSAVTDMSTGHPVRCIRNKMTKEYLRLEKEGASLEELELLTLGSLRKSVMEGDVVDGTIMAGQSAGLVKKEQSCKEILEEIMQEVREAFRTSFFQK